MPNISEILQIITFLGVVFLGLSKWYWQSGQDKTDLHDLDTKVNDIDRTVREIQIDVALIKGRLTAPPSGGGAGGGFFPTPLATQKLDSHAH